MLIVGTLAAGLVGYSAFRGGKIVHGVDVGSIAEVAAASAAAPAMPSEEAP